MYLPSLSNHSPSQDVPFSAYSLHLLCDPSPFLKLQMNVLLTNDIMQWGCFRAFSRLEDDYSCSAFVWIWWCLPNDDIYLFLFFWGYVFGVVHHLTMNPPSGRRGCLIEIWLFNKLLLFNVGVNEDSLIVFASWIPSKELTTQQQ